MEWMVTRLWLMSLQACALIVVVLIARLLLKKYPKVLSYSLWALVGLRLLCPVFVESSFSLQPEFKAVSEVIREQETNQIAGISPKDVEEDVIQNPVQESVMPDITLQTGPEVELSDSQSVSSGTTAEIREPQNSGVVEEKNSFSFDVNRSMLVTVYLLGVALMAGSYLVRYLLMWGTLRPAVRKEEQIWLSDRIQSPFVMGIFHPRIFLPYGLEEKEERYILLHEQAHIRHHDSLIRGIGILCLCLHWWNPLVWVAVRFMSKDMEMFCDEAAVKAADATERKAYAETLLNFSVRRSGLSLELAFGESNAEQRIKNIIKNKKRSRVVLGIVVVIALICGVAFLTIPKQETGGNAGPEQITEPPVPTVAEEKGEQLNPTGLPGQEASPMPAETQKPSQMATTAPAVNKKQAHVFTRNEVREKYPEPEYTLERMMEAGTVRTLKGNAPGTSVGTWYIIEHGGVVYYWFCQEGKAVAEAELYSYALTEKAHSLINGLQVTMTKEEVLRRYPDMAVVDIKGEVCEESPEWNLGFNSAAFPHSYAGMDESFNYGDKEIWYWQEQFDYCLLAEIEGETRQGRAMALALMMKNDKVEAITFYCPNDGSITLEEWRLDISSPENYGWKVPNAFKFSSLLDKEVIPGSEEEEILLAYQKILYDLLYEEKMPDGSECDAIYEITFDRFSVCDVDMDGRDELMIIHSAASGAQTRTYILEYKPESDTLYEEAVIYPGGSAHANGILVSVASQNHSKASFRPERSLTPYSVYQYNAATDSYEFLYEVSAWDKYCHTANFPDKADLDGDGMVYCFTPDGTWQDGAAYESWYAETFEELAKEKGDASWKPLTEEYIAALVNK